MMMASIGHDTAERNTEIQVAMGGLQLSTNALTEVLCRLEETLVSVMRQPTLSPESENKTGIAKQEGFSAPHAIRIQDITDSLEVSIAKIKDIQSRLEI